MRIAVIASTQPLSAGLEGVVTHTSGGTQTSGKRKRAKGMAEFIDHCWNDRPDVDPIGICTGRQSERGIGEQLAVGPHEDAPVPSGVVTLPGELHLEDAQEETEVASRSRQSPSESVPGLQQGQVSRSARRKVGVLGVGHQMTENHTQRIFSTLEVQARTRPMSVALQRRIPDRTYALPSQSGRSLSNA